MRLSTGEWPLLQRVCLSKDRNLPNDVGLDWIWTASPTAVDGIDKRGELRR